MTVVVAQWSEWSNAARIISRRPLLYTHGPDAALDRPGHVRAASALAFIGGRLAVVQDDANFIALLDPIAGDVQALTLPAGAEGARQFDDTRGNKSGKLDLETCALVPDRDASSMIIALASGSRRKRDHIVLLRPDPAGTMQARMRRAPAFYAMLRDTHAFSGSELNIEGAAFRDDRLWIFGRGNGAPNDERRPVNATCTFDWPTLRAYLDDPAHGVLPMVQDIVQYDLGALRETPFGFTDATPWRDGFLFSAVVEASRDASTDGTVGGCALGVLVPGQVLTCSPIADESGRKFTGKIEGLATGPGSDRLVHAVIDADDPTRPSELCLVDLGDGLLHASAER